MSGFRVARELGSQNVVSKSDEIRFARTPNWGVYGLGAIIVCILVILIGFYFGFKKRMHTYYSRIMMAISFIMLILTIVYPFYLPPFQEVYQILCVLILLLVTLGFFIAKVWARVQKQKRV